MIMLKNFIIILVSISLSVSGMADPQYVVQSGETLSHILYKRSLKPIYGKSGYLNQVIVLNPVLVIAKGNLIFPGQLLILPNQNQTEKSHLTKISQQQGIEKSESLEKTDSVSALDIHRDIADQMSSRFPNSQLQLGLMSNYFRIDVNETATNKEVVVLSDLNWGFNLGYLVQWDEKLQTKLNLSYLSYSIKDLAGRYDFSKRKDNMWGFGFELAYFLNDRIKPYLGYDFKQELFVSSATSNVFDIDEVYIAQPYLGFDYVFLNQGRFSIGSGLNYTYLQSESMSEYSISNGQKLSAYIYLVESMRSNKDLGLKFKVGYEEGRQNSSVSDQNNKKIYLNIDMNWRL